MNNARNQKCMVLILAMIVGIGFVSCGDLQRIVVYSLHGERPKAIPRT